MKTTILALLAAMVVLCASTMAEVKNDNADDWYNTGISLLDNGSIEESFVYFDKSLLLYNENIKQDPADYKSWLDKANVLSMVATLKNDSYKLNEAVNAYNQAAELVDSDRTRVDIWSTKATVMRNLGRLDEANKASESAIDEFDKISELSSHDWNAKAYLLGDLGRYNESLDAYDKAIGLMHANQTDEVSRIWTSKGATLLKLNRTEDAIKAFDEAIHIDPQRHDVWVFMGQSFAKLGKYNESLEAYENALAMEPDDENAWMAKADVLEEMGEHGEADKSYAKTLELLDDLTMTELDNSAIWSIGKGDVFTKMGKYDYALLAYENAIETASYNPYILEANITMAEGWIGKGNVFNLMGQYEESAKAFDNAIKISPDYRWTPLKYKGDALMSQGRYDAALELYDKVTKLSPWMPNAWIDKGLALKALDRNHEADVAFNKARDMGYYI